MFAVRNAKLCTKDCLCLFVCPTGATATEDGSIDASLCIDGCRLCVDACPSHAIYLLPERLAERPVLEGELKSVVVGALENKARTAAELDVLLEREENPTAARTLAGLRASNRILGEDCVRAAGYMVPAATHMRGLIESELLQNQAEETGDEQARADMDALLEVIVEGLQENRDCAPVQAWLCRECGLVMLEEPATGHCRRCEAEVVPASGNSVR